MLPVRNRKAVRPRLSTIPLLAALWLLGCSTPGPTTATPDDRADSATDASTPPPPGERLLCPEQALTQVWQPVAGDLNVPGDLGRILACAHVDTLTPERLVATGLFGPDTPQTPV